MRILNSSRSARQLDARRESGTVMIVVALGVVGLLAFAAVALDGGYMTATRGQLQHVADSGALAGMTAVRDGLSPAQATALAKQIAEDTRHEAGGDPVFLSSGDIEFGTFDLASRTFSVGTRGTGVSAFRVTVRRESGSATGALDLFFGGVTGLPQVDISASAVAAVRRRDVVLVQDRTNSFVQEFDDAIAADLGMVSAMAGGMALSGDRVGVVTFGRIAQEEIGLTELASNGSEVVRTLKNLTVCQDTRQSSGCNGTGTADGIKAAIDVYERDSLADDAEKIMVVVTDGVPCYPEIRGNEVARAEADAIAAADLAISKGISIYVIALAVPAPSGAHICYQVPRVEFGPKIARGFGYSVTTPDSNDIDGVLVSIVNQMPVRLVQ